MKHIFSQDGGVNHVRLEKYDTTLENFIEIDEQLADSPEIEFFDDDVEVNSRPYLYRTLSVDTCDQVVAISNLGETIFLSSVTN